jgi:hypothetical protein
MQEVSTIGTGGRHAGMFQAVHSIDTDSQGNIYVTETYEGRQPSKPPTPAPRSSWTSLHPGAREFGS